MICVSGALSLKLFRAASPRGAPPHPIYFKELKWFFWNFGSFAHKDTIGGFRCVYVGWIVINEMCVSKFITPMKLKDFMDSQFWSFGMEPLKVLPDTCRVH